MGNTSVISKIFGSVIGLFILLIGVINTFWGNDPGFGIFIILLSFVFFPFTNTRLSKLTGLYIPLWLKFLFFFLILWAALGVGELFDKIRIMLQEFKY